MKIQASFCLIVVLLFTTSLSAQTSTYSIQGKVVDQISNEPIVGAIVESHELSAAVFTDSLGLFILENLPSGKHHIHVEMTGFKAYANYFSTTDSSIADVLILLEPSHIELQQVLIESEVSRSDYTHQSLDLMVLGKDDLRGSASMTLSQKLSRLPGVTQLSSGANIAKPVIRGLSGNRILVSDLGMKQEGQQWGSDHGLELDPYGVDRIEVVKGPASLLYGSDALGGVIRVQTPGVPEKGIRGQVQSMYRSNNDYIGGSASMEGAAQHFFAKARVTWSEFGDYKIPAETFTYLNRTLPIYNHRLRNTSGKELHYQTTIGWAGKRGVVKSTWSHFHQKNGLFPGIVGIPTGANVADDGDRRDIDLPHQVVDHLKLAINASLTREKGWLQIDAGVQQNTRREMIRPHQQGYAPLPTDANAHRLVLTTYQASIRWHRHEMKHWRFIPGASASWQQNSRAGWEFLLPNDRSVTAGTFLFAERNFESKNIIINGGLRVDGARVSTESFSTARWSSDQEIVGYDLRVANNDREFYSWSGSAGLSYTPSKRWNLKWNLARSFRVPNHAELFINGVHHGTFRHEQGNASLNNEIGYQADFTALFESKSFYVKMTPYFNYFEGFIYLRPTAQFSTLPDGGQVYQYTQHDAIFTGAELYAEWHPIEALHLEGSIDGVYSYNLITTLPLPFTPPVRGRVQATFERDLKEGALKGYELGATYLVWSSQFNVDRNEEPTKGAYSIDLFAQTSWKWGAQELVVKLALNNLLDRYYLNHLSAYRQLNLPEQGRNISVLIQLPIGK